MSPRKKLLLELVATIDRINESAEIGSGIWSDSQMSRRAQDICHKDGFEKCRQWWDLRTPLQHRRILQDVRLRINLDLRNEHKRQDIANRESARALSKKRLDEIKRELGDYYNVKPMPYRSASGWVPGWEIHAHVTDVNKNIYRIDS